MFKIICVTNRALTVNFLRQIEETAAAKPDAVILREKDLSESEYGVLAADVLRICREKGVKCIFHTFAAAAKAQKADGIHLTLSALRGLAEKAYFAEIGCSVHSAEEAAEAQSLGATYLTVGHIFQTDCKKGAAPHGTEMLRRISEVVSLPVYAIGGIDASNAKQCIAVGAAGVCMMSEFMKSGRPSPLVRSLRRNALFPEQENGSDIPFDKLTALDGDAYIIIDVRAKTSFSLGSIKGAVNVPFPQEAARLYEISKEKPVIVCCQRGEVSREVTELLVDAGYEAYNLQGGYLGWLIKREGGMMND